MGLITLWKTANTVPHGDRIVMVILLFLMDSLKNEPEGGKDFSDKLQQV